MTALFKGYRISVELGETMSLSLLNHLHHVMTPELRADIAQAIDTTQPSADEAINLVIPMVLARLMSKYFRAGPAPVYQLLHANMLENIPSDAPLDIGTLYVARDTGRSLATQLFVSEADMDAAEQAVADHSQLNTTQAEDLLNMLATLIIRELALLGDSSAIPIEQFGTVLGKQGDYLQGQAPDWVFEKAGLSNLAGKPILHPLTEPVVVQAIGAGAPSAAEGRLEAAAQAREVQAATPKDPDPTPAVITEGQKKGMGRSDKKWLVLLVLGLAVLAMAIIGITYYITNQESLRRANLAPHALDTGSNGAGSVAPQYGGPAMQPKDDGGVISAGTVSEMAADHVIAEGAAQVGSNAASDRGIDQNVKVQTQTTVTPADLPSNP